MKTGLLPEIRDSLSIGKVITMGGLDYVFLREEDRGIICKLLTENQATTKGVMSASDEIVVTADHETQFCWDDRRLVTLQDYRISI